MRRGRWGRVLTRVLALGVDEVIVIDDGSSDGSVACCLGFGEAVTVLQHPRNLGKGAAIQSGLLAASGDVVVIQDADLEYFPEEIPSLLEAFGPGVDAVFGSRFLHPALPLSYRYSLHGLANRFLTFFSNCFTGLRLTDMETCYKVISKRFYQQLSIQEQRFGIEPEICAKLAKLGARVVERPIRYSPRSHDEGKKIGFRDGLRAIWCILRY